MTNKANSILPRMRTRAAVSTRLAKVEASDSGNAVLVALSHVIHTGACAAVSIKIATVVLAMVAGTLGVRERTAVVLL